jgi:organic radical activating enzyme
LEAQRYAQIETNTTFGNLKGTNILWVAKNAIKQMKRLQNPRMLDRDDGNDMEHQGEDEDHVLSTMENNSSKKAKEKKFKRILIEVMATHEILTKKFFESNLKKNSNMLSQIHLILG